MLQDLRYALRTILKSPGLMAVAVLSLGLGIGLNTTIFGLFKSVFLTGVTARDAEHVLHVWVGGSNRASYPNYRDLRDAKAVQELAGYDVTQFRWDHGDRSEKIFAQAVTGNYFDLLGAGAALGRTFSSDEKAPERGAQVAVVTHSFWQHRLAGDPNILGQALNLGGKPFTIVGVLPRGYRSVHGFGIEPPVYVPFSRAVRHDLENRESRRLELIARVAPGVTPPQAQSALLAAAKELERLHPAANLHFGERVEAYPVYGLQKMKREGFPMPLLAFFTILMVIVTLVLMIACANVAGLLLARAANRRREVAVRLAIGATRMRLVRLFLAESLTLALLGAAAAGLLHLWAAGAVSRLNLPVPIPVQFQLEPDWRILLYALLVTLATAALCGIAPALEASRSNVSRSLKDDAALGTRRRLFTLRNTMVVGQVAVSLVLLVTSFLFVRSLIHVQTVDPGFNVSRHLIANVDLDPARYGRARTAQFYEQAIDVLREVPGSAAASAGLIVPLSGNSYMSDLEIDGHSKRPVVRMNLIARGYFETLGVPVLRGRQFRSTDGESAPRVVVANQTFAQRFFPETGALGRTVRLLEGREQKPVPAEIIGVVADAKYETLGEDPAPVLYQSFLQANLPGVGMNLHIQTAGAPATMIAPVKAALARIDPSITSEVKTMEEVAATSLIPNRIGAYLLGFLGATGLALASIGLYGVIAYAVSRRTREIGIRMALGSSRSGVLKTVLGDAGILVGTGLVLGLLLSIAAAQPLRTFIAGVGVFDPFTLAGVVVTLALVALAAAAVPARRAMRIDPITALRHE